MRHLVEDEGLVMGSTVLYESHRVPYGRDGRRHYVVDFALPDRRTLIEVKPLHRTQTTTNRAKRAGAEKWCRENGWSYVIVTEKEISAVGRIISLEEAAKMPGVVLGERAARALRRKMNRKARKR